MMVSAKKAGEIILRSGVLERIRDYGRLYPELYVFRRGDTRIWEFACYKDHSGDVTNILVVIGSNYWMFSKRIKKEGWYLYAYREGILEENLLKSIIEEIREFCIREVACRILEVL